MAHVFSWRVRKISILPFGGVAEVDEHGNRTLKEEFLVVLAGPIQHVWMIGLALGLQQLEVVSPHILELFIQLNLMVLLFNLLPIWPLDGGKFISIIFANYFTFLKSFEYTLLCSLSFLALFNVIVLIIAPLNLNLWIVLSFLYVSLWGEWKQRRYIFMKFLLERYYGKTTNFHTLKPIVVDGDEDLLTVLERFQRGFKHPLVVFQNGSEVGKLDENEVLHAFFAEKMTTAKTRDLLYVY